jgi:pyruvate,water dikinase
LRAASEDVNEPSPGGGEPPPEARYRIALACRVAHVLDAADAREAAGYAAALAARDAEKVSSLAARRIIWPVDGGFEIEPLAGSKAANLAEIGRLGAAELVPPWFVLTDRAFREALASPAPPRPGGPWAAGREPRTLGDAIEAVVGRDDAEPAQKAALVEQLWEDARLPAALIDEMTSAYTRLSMMTGVDAPHVAIRSSAREEDTAEALRAGEFNSFLFVRGAASVLQHVRRAWSGLWTARAIHERTLGGRPGAGEGGGVIVQAIVWARVSGVLQTTNVAGNRPREMVINVGLGLGEGIVSGLVAADHIVISKDEDPAREPLRFRYVVADKRERMVFDAVSGTGTMRADVLAHQRLRAALEYAELVELVLAGARLEAAYGYPLDIEFGFDDSRLRVLQVRPVPGTTAVWQACAALCAAAGIPGTPSGDAS